MTITAVYCEECDNQINDEQPNYCPECGAENPWEERPVYDMDDVDFPVIVEIEHYNDNHGLWREFCQTVFDVYELKGSDIANMPDNLPSMKYNVVYYYMVVGREDIEGPFLEESEARKAKSEMKQNSGGCE